MVSTVLQRVMLMDEISTGLDSATTYTVTEFLRSTTHYLHLTTLVSLLQPPPEVFNLFDDVILLSDGQATDPFTFYVIWLAETFAQLQFELKCSMHLHVVSVMANAESGTILLVKGCRQSAVLPKAAARCMYLVICITLTTA